ncbi:exonuclease SbcC [Natronincola peptidivorans]|uniref:Nuclease SbcCD subunit C n=1 Tax=Natronincola peptidivorans TaxID=426128 RepID=A0A1I0DVW0_9FIRM|nr:SbcC/MukB-like Walker B domain-containing protein [Natronincola peptidivorans]SET36633.1 exonuclease SbcC [Natronincola peptidivorans]
MKPIKLKFAGLQSYREEQEIDLLEVGALGIFGIFGPTGAGKSTILDAITLALYGNVERAPNGIRGIMNHFTDLLYVSFEFALGEKQYLVERSYKRNKREDTITNKVSRLIKVQEEKEILADKANEVTETIESLLGMKFRDFTRAVIIPQNKFDQFLKLTEKDRTEMLEKIFCLEEYGERLTEKVKKLEKDLESKYEGNKSRMAELGDASQETIQQVEEQLKDKRRIAAEKAKEGKQLEKQLKKLEIAAGIHQEMVDRQQEKEKLQQQRTEIEKQQQQLRLAKKAEGFEDTLEQLKKLKQEMQEKKTELKAEEKAEANIDEAIKEARVQLENSKEKQQLVNRLKEEELPKLPLAANYEKQIEELQGETKELTKEINEKKKKFVMLEKEHKENNKILENEKKAILELRKTKKRMNNILLCREEVENAIASLQRLEVEEKQEKDASHELQKKEKEQKKEEEALRILLKKYIHDTMLDTEKASLQQLVGYAEGIVKEVEEKQTIAEEMVTTAIEKNMAGELSSKLKEGEPCQVCGSTHHPKPAIAEEETEKDPLQRAKEKLQTIKKEAKEIRQWLQQVNIQYTTEKNIMKEIQSFYKDRWMKKVADLQKIKADFESALVLLQEKINQITANYKVTDRNTVKTLKEHLREAEEAYQKVTEEIESKEDAVKDLEKKIHGLKEECNHLETNVKISLENIEKNNKKAQQLKENIESLIGNTTVAVYEEQIKTRITELEKQIRTAEEIWESTNKRKQEIQQRLAILKSSIENSIKHLETMENHLKDRLANAGFSDIVQLENALIEKEKQEAMEEKINNYEKAWDFTLKSLETLEKKAEENPFDKGLFEGTKELNDKNSEEYERIVKEEGGLQKNLEDLKEKQKRWKELQEVNKQIGEKIDLVTTLFNLLKRKRFVKFLAEEHMRDMAVEASIKLGELTGQRYRLELDDKGNFIMRDDYSGGEGRLVTSLSGGETFLTSLALALALSSKIQLKGELLGFFFLDEGFGTLDNEKLELVMNTLEKLRKDQRMVGIISHVGELKNRMPRYMEVTAAQQNGAGSKVVVKHN